MKIQEFADKSLLLAVGAAHRALWLPLEKKLRQEGCSPLQAMALIAVFFERDGVVTPSKLARVFQATPANVSHCISNLERRGFLKRELHAEDARSYRIALKTDGRKLALRLIRVIDRLENRFDERHGRERVQQLVKALRSLGAENA